jgi:glycosyltransferase involved in cell wall biosynthesis
MAATRPLIAAGQAVEGKPGSIAEVASAGLRPRVASIAVVLPVHNQEDHIGGLVHEYLEVTRRLEAAVELVLVANGCTDASAEVCRRLADRYEEVQAIECVEGGWGRAVRAGLAAADAELVGYANSARTSPKILTLMLSYALAYPNVALKANRRIRDSPVRRIGSLLYNLECRTLFDLATWDVNGTPKIFPRSFKRLLDLRSNGDLIDIEFVLACKQERYPIVEIPLLATTRLGGRSTTSYRSALRMYRGAVALRRNGLPA